MCNVIDLETQNNLQYVFFPVSSGVLRFKVKAANDAHIALTNGSFESDPMTELHIGGWDNTKSIVRRNRREPDRVKVETPGILNRNEYVGMWISWHNGRIAAGLEGSETPFMEYKDPALHPIDHAAVRTGWGSTGSWKIEVSPVIFKQLATKPLSDDGDLHWVQMTSNDKIPNGAVIGGFDKGEIVYVARARHSGALCPGKYVPSLKLAVVGYGLRAHEKYSFEILCGYNLQWVRMQGNALPPHAFPGGIAPETRDEVLFIGRAPIENSLIPGKIHLHYKTLYITYEDLEKEMGPYEVLVIPDKIPKQISSYNSTSREQNNPQQRRVDYVADVLGRHREAVRNRQVVMQL